MHKGQKVHLCGNPLTHSPVTFLWECSSMVSPPIVDTHDLTTAQSGQLQPLLQKYSDVF